MAQLCAILPCSPASIPLTSLRLKRFSRGKLKYSAVQQSSKEFRNLPKFYCIDRATPQLNFKETNQFTSDDRPLPRRNLNKWDTISTLNQRSLKTS